MHAEMFSRVLLQKHPWLVSVRLRSGCPARQTPGSLFRSTAAVEPAFPEPSCRAAAKRRRERSQRSFGARPDGGGQPSAGILKKGREMPSRDPETAENGSPKSRNRRFARSFPRKAASSGPIQFRQDIRRRDAIMSRDDRPAPPRDCLRRAFRYRSILATSAGMPSSSA